jgi:capsular polysaccharide biosynthesis protein
MLKRLAHHLRDLIVSRIDFEQAWPSAQRKTFLEPEKIATPESLELPFATEATHLRAATYESPAAWWAVVEGALYLSDQAPAEVILAHRGRIVTESDNIYLEQAQASAMWTYPWKPMYLRGATRIRGRCMVFRSPASNYYHTLVDNLPRLLALYDPALKGRNVSVLVPETVRPFENWFLERLLPSHARIVRVRATNLYRPDELVFASYASRQMCGFLPRQFINFLNARVLPSRRSRRGRRIYISRAAIRPLRANYARRIKNEEDVAELLQRYAFERVILEDLPQGEQIETLFDATAVVSAHGAGLTNLLFCTDADVIELHPRRTLLPHYYYLCKACGHRYRYVCGSEVRRNDDFEVDLNELELQLRSLDAEHPPTHP